MSLSLSPESVEVYRSQSSTYLHQSCYQRRVPAGVVTYCFRWKSDSHMSAKTEVVLIFTAPAMPTQTPPHPVSSAPRFSRLQRSVLSAFGASSPLVSLCHAPAALRLASGYRPECTDQVLVLCTRSAIFNLLSPHANRLAGDISVTIFHSFIHSFNHFVRRIFGNGYLVRGLT